MTAPASRICNSSNWLVTLVHAYLAFVVSARLVTTAMRCAAAIIGAAITYGLIMLVLAAFWRDSAYGAIGCAGSMTIAVMCGARAAGAMLLPAHRRAGIGGCTVLATLYPLLLAAGSAPDAPIRAMQFLYVATSAIGGFAALRTLAFTRLVPDLRAATFGAPRPHELSPPRRPAASVP